MGGVSEEGRKNEGGEEKRGGYGAPASPLTMEKFF